MAIEETVETYKKLRQELSIDYVSEISRVKNLLANGIGDVHDGKALLDVSQTGSLVALGEARKVFREEAWRAMQLILERYERNLKREALGLGITLVDHVPAAARSEPGARATDEERAA